VGFYILFNFDNPFHNILHRSFEKPVVDSSFNSIYIRGDSIEIEEEISQVFLESAGEIMTVFSD